MLVKVFEVGAYGSLKVDHSLDGTEFSDPLRQPGGGGGSHFDVAGKPDRRLRLKTEIEADRFNISDWPGAYSGDPVRVAEFSAGGFAIAFGLVEVHILLDPIALKMGAALEIPAP